MKLKFASGALEKFCNVEYGTRVVRKNDAGTIYPVYGGGGATFYLDTYNREDRVVVARFAMSEQCTRRVAGKFALNDSGLTLSTKDSLVLRQDLLDYLILSLNDDIYDSARGTAQKNLDVPGFRNMMIYFPLGESEQKTIVEKLDAAFAEIDKLEANLETKSRYTNELLNSILGSTFSGDNADPNPHQGPAVKMVELGDIASIQTGKIDVNKAVPGGKYPFFTCSKDTYKIDEAPFEGKVILVAGNGDLNVKYYEGKFNAYQRTYFLFVNNEEIVFPKYLYYFLESYVGQLRAESIGSTIKYIKMGNLTDAEMPLPSLPEQKAIVEKLDTAFAEIDKLREWTKQAKQSFSALRQSILSSVFTEKSDAA